MTRSGEHLQKTSPSSIIERSTRGTLASIKSLQPSNAHCSINFTLHGIFILVNPALMNAIISMLETLSGITMFARLLHPENVPHSIIVTASGMITFVRLLQFANADCPILVIVLGIITSLRFLQLQKACPPILVIPSGIVITEGQVPFCLYATVPNTRIPSG